MESRHWQTTILLIKFEAFIQFSILILFSLQRLHLLLITNFKANRLNNKKKNLKRTYKLLIALDFVTQGEQK